ncbi:MAG: hypothetical protein ABEJ55_05125 [Halanaeroarchaeum sp.]
MRRRDVLTAAGTGAIAALAGCTGALGSVAPPAVPTQRLESGGWEQQSERQETVFEQSYGPVTVQAKAHSLVYSDVALRKDIAEKTLGRVDGRMAIFSATRVQFSPNLADLPGDIGTDQIVSQTADAAREQFRTEMTDAGLQDVEAVGTGTVEIDTGESAETTQYEATFPFSDVEFPVTDDQTITIEGEPLTVEGILAVWSHEGSVLVAGGAYPAENVDKTVTEQLSSAITVSVDIDLGLDPAALREEMLSLITAVK